MKCLYCGYEMTNHETLDKQTNPKVGDVSFCVNCGGVSIFTKENKLKKIKIESLEKDIQEEIKEISKAWLKSQIFAKNAKHDRDNDLCSRCNQKRGEHAVWTNDRNDKCCLKFANAVNENNAKGVKNE